MYIQSKNSKITSRILNASLSTNKIPIVVASIVVYANDKRRFNYKDPLANSSIPKEGSTNTNRIIQLLSNKYPKLQVDNVDLTLFDAAHILLEFFHDTDEDILEVFYGNKTDNAVCCDVLDCNVVLFLCD